MMKMLSKLEEWASESFWRILGIMLVLGFGGMGAIALVAWIVGDPAGDARKTWCGQHGYAVAGLSSGGGKFRINEIVCLDSQRRMVLPE